MTDETPQVPILVAMWLDRVSADEPHDGTAWFRDPDYDGPCEAIAPDKVDRLSELFLEFIASAISQILDAGSERDAVNENEDLLDAIKQEVRGWTVQG